MAGSPAVGHQHAASRRSCGPIRTRPSGARCRCPRSTRSTRGPPCSPAWPPPAADQLVPALRGAPHRARRSRSAWFAAHLERRRLPAAVEVLERVAARPTPTTGAAVVARRSRAGRRPRLAMPATFRSDWRASLPGELAPKLAMAVARARHPTASRATPRRSDPAARYYELVSRTDPAYASAASAWPRTRQLLGDRAAAAERFDQIPSSSSSARRRPDAWCRVLCEARRGPGAALLDTDAARTPWPRCRPIRRPGPS